MLSSDKSDSLDGESDDDGYYSRSAGTRAFPFCFEESVCRDDNSVGRVYCVGSGFFVPTGIRSIGDVVPLVVFVPT